MAFRAFLPNLSTVRAVEIPRDLDAARRAQFVARIQAAVEKQKGLAERSETILRVERVEESGERVLIWHEPAYPADAAAIFETTDRPKIETLWWFTWATINALAAAAKAGVVHGGIQPGVYYLDRLGRLKLGDWGVIVAFDQSIQPAQRTRLALDPEAATVDEANADVAAWVMLEDESRPFGWARPFSAPEQIIETPARTFSFDQFAAGVTLYLLASRAHPYDGEFNEPEFYFYPRGDARPLTDFVADWGKIFERGDANAALASDKPVLQWSEFLMKLIAPFSAGRFQKLEDALALAKPYCPEAWSEASQSLEDALDLLSGRDKQWDQALTIVGRWLDDDRLPTPWRDALGSLAKTAETEQAKEQAERSWRDKLDEIDSLSQSEQLAPLEKALRIAKELATEPQCPDEIRANAEKRVGAIQQTIRSLREASRARATERLAEAREAFPREEYAVVAAAIQEITADDWSPEELRAEAETLAERVGAAEDAINRVAPILDDVAGAISTGAYDRARTLIEALIPSAAWPDSLLLRRDELEAQVGVAAALDQESQRVFEQVDAALDQLDVDAAEHTLQEAYFDPTDTRAATQVNLFQREFERMRLVLAAISAANAASERGEFDQGMRAVREVLSTTGVRPAAIRVAQEIYDRCAAAKDRDYADRRAGAVKLLDEAQRLWDAGEWRDVLAPLDELERSLQAILQPDDKSLIADLRARNQRARELNDALDRAVQLAKSQRHEEAKKLLKELRVEGAPPPLVERHAQLVAQADAGIAAHWARLRESLEQAHASLRAGEIAAAERLFQDCDRALGVATGGASQSLPREIAKLHKKIDAELQDARKLTAALEAGREALRAKDAQRALAEIAKVAAPPGWEWASSKVEALRGEAKTLAVALLDKTLQALAECAKSGDNAKGAALLAKANELIEYDRTRESTLAESQKILAQVVANQAEIAEIEKLQASKKWREVEERAKAFLSAKPHASLKPRAEVLKREAAEQLEAELRKLEEDLAKVEATLQAAQRAPRGAAAQLDALQKDPRINKAQRARIDAARAKLAELKAKGGGVKTPAIIGGLVVVGLVVGLVIVNPFASKSKNTGADRSNGTQVVAKDDQTTPPVHDDGGKASTQHPQTTDEGSGKVASDGGTNKSSATLPQRDTGDEGTGVTQKPTDDQGKTAGGKSAQTSQESSEQQKSPPEDDGGKATQREPQTQDTTSPPHTEDKQDQHQEEPPPPPPPPPPPQIPDALAPLRNGATLDANSLWAAVGYLAPQWAKSHASLQTDFAGRVASTANADETSARLTLQVGEKSFELQAAVSEANEWRASETENSAALEACRKEVAGLLLAAQLERIKTLREAEQEGGLIEAHLLNAEIENERGLLTAWGATANASELAVPKLPPRWDGSASGVRVVTPADKSDPLGYPLRVQIAGHTLDRVVLPRSSPIWSDIAGSADGLGAHLRQKLSASSGQHPWVLFYIESPDPKRNDLKAALAEFSGGLTAPTVDEWIVAFLAGDPAAFAYGAWDWAVDEQKSPWVLGGCEEFKPLLPMGGDRLTWLNQPLVSQPRKADFGDGLAGCRAVWRPNGWPTLEQQLQ